MDLQESQYVELKESWRDEYLKTVSAFANTAGGTLYIGYNDNGKVIGVDKSKRLLEDLPNKIINSLGLTASVKATDIDGKTIIEIAVPKSIHPISYQSKYYTRSGSTTQEIKGSELQQLLLRANNLSWDEITVPDASFNDIDETIVRLFIKRAIEYNRLPSGLEQEDMQRLFHNLELTNNARELTRASLLLFGKQPTRFFSSAMFKIGRFKKDNPTDLILQDFVEGNIFQMPDKVMDLLKSKYLLSPISYKGLQRIETLEIPEKAMREAVLNAIIHRDYSSTSSIELRVFDTTITLWNHGILESPLTIDMLKETHSSYPRNSLIAKMFYRAGYIESWGRGTLTIINETQSVGLPEPIFNDFSHGVQIVFQRNPFPKVADSQPLNEKLNSRQQKAIEYVRKHGEINNTAYQELTESTKKTATRDLKQLIEQGVFISKKEGKNVFYRFNKIEDNI